MDFLSEALVFLGAAVLVVPLLERAGLSPVLGYIAAGIIVGPSVLGLIGDPQAVLQFADFGIVMLLFVIGLELQPARLWALRRAILAMGSLQFGATAALLFVAGLLAGLSAPASAVIAIALSTSSTAVGIAMLEERHRLASRSGRSATAVLLFQDLAVIGLLALLPMLAGESNLAFVGPDWLSLTVTAGLLIGAVVVGRRLLRPFLRMIAASTNDGLMTAAVLFVVLGASQLMALAALSTALGALLAGILLADSEYRHEVESRINPFRGLLVGLFFLALGMSLDLGLVIERPLLAVVLTLALIVTKFLTMLIIARAFRHDIRDAVELAATLAQAGEFAFVILSFSVASALIDTGLSGLLSAVIVMSIAATPLFTTSCLHLLRVSGRALPDDEDTRARRLRVFLSYAREDSAIAQQLVARLEDDGFDVTIDTRDLPFGEEWQKELDYGIRQADEVIWLVSPASLESEWCAWELERVAEHRKRLVPLVVEAVPPAALPEAIARIQLLPAIGVFELKDDAQFRLLVATLRADRRWLKEHTRLAERARQWAAAARGADWLLRGAELEQAEIWRDRRPAGAPAPGAAVLDLIHASRQNSGGSA